MVVIESRARIVHLKNGSTIILPPKYVQSVLKSLGCNDVKIVIEARVEGDGGDGA